MKRIEAKYYATKSVAWNAVWTFAFAVCLMFLGVVAAHMSVTHAQNMPMQMAQNNGQTTNAKGETHEVSIDNFSFTPMEMTIPAGSQVTWINKDDVPHTVVSVSHNFKSQALDTDEKFSFTFSNPGTYEYFCSVHPKMTGKIFVK